MRFVLASGIFPPEIGGPATVIADLALELGRQGHHVQVATYGDGPSDETVVRVSRSGSVALRYVRFAMTLRRSLSSDAVVLATDVFSVGIPTRLALVGRKNRFAVRLGGEWAWEDAVTNGGLRITLREYWKQAAHGMRHQCKMFIYGWIIRRAHRILITSKMLGDVLEQVDPTSQSRVIVVPNKAPDACRVPRLAESRHRPLRLMTVGRFAPVKNMPFFARVLVSCREQGIDVVCTFVGDGPELEETQRLLKDVPGMDFVGKQTQDQIVDRFSEIDVLALPSLTDICPNSVLEALRCGVPCLITTEHGLPDEVRGFRTASPTHVDEWRDAIAALTDALTYQSLRDAITLPESTASLAQACLAI